MTQPPTLILDDQTLDNLVTRIIDTPYTEIPPYIGGDDVDVYESRRLAIRAWLWKVLT